MKNKNIQIKQVIYVFNEFKDYWYIVKNLDPYGKGPPEYLHADGVFRKTTKSPTDENIWTGYYKTKAKAKKVLERYLQNEEKESPETRS